MSQFRPRGERPQFRGSIPRNPHSQAQSGTDSPGSDCERSAPWQLLLVWNPWYWIYLGLLRAYAGEAGVSTLPLHWPGYPSWMFVVFPVLLSGTGAAILARIYRRRVQ